MSKWKIHRPAAQSKKAAGRSTKSKPTTKPNERKPSSGRWIIHKPSEANPPSGHGWHFDGNETTRRGNRMELGERWTCDYGCKSFVWTTSPEPGQYHAYDCPYWQNEGKELTPF